MYFYIPGGHEIQNVLLYAGPYLPELVLDLHQRHKGQVYTIRLMDKSLNEVSPVFLQNERHHR